MYRKLNFIKYMEALKACTDLYGRLCENFSQKMTD